jgi:hopanoid biosynthesis associated RND transporter like protein HpnN
LGFITSLVRAAQKQSAACIVIFLALAGVGLWYSAGHLSIDTDTDHLFASTLPWRQAEIQESRDFPQFDRLIVGVVRAATPEEATETAAALSAGLSADKADFLDSSYPSGSPFFTHEGLLLLPPNDLAQLLSQIVAAQPFLGQLAADPSARGLFTGLGLIALGVQAGADISPYDTAIRAVQHNLQEAAQGQAQPLSWQSLIMSGGAGSNGAEFVLAHPKLNQGALQPGGVATASLVRIAHDLPDVKVGRATVDYTGQIPLSDEQFASLTQGLGLGICLTILVISLWLFLALRSWRLIVPILLTLVLGLVLTITFAAIFVKVMNLISVAFAILFIGLAVDFAIQYCVRLRDVRHVVPEADAALVETGRQAGGQIALAATATACGFLAFSPTSFVGVAELGEIAGAGMFIAFFCTITFLPALLVFFRPGAEAGAVALPGGAWADAFLQRRRHGVLACFAFLAGLGLFAMATTKFDANPLDTQSPDTEAMRTLNSMLADPQTNPFSAVALAPNLDAAREMAARLSKLPEVAEAISGATFVPEQQDEKLAMLGQAQTILAPTLLAAATPPRQAVTAADIRAAMAKTRAAILQVQSKLPQGAPLLAIAGTLGQLQGVSDAQLLAMNAAITRFLPQELNSLVASLGAQPITVENLAPEVKRDWFLPNGEVRVQAYPTPKAQTNAGLRVFARAVQAAVPSADGPAISTLATAGTILGAFREAAILAFAAIAVILLAVFRNWRDSALVLATLALSALLTALFAKAAGLSINYANIIALPLLLGVGVSFNVYFVMNYRAGMRRFMSSATAHAILFSALTTATAFGSLAASADRGTSSMGELLLLSLGAVLVATFGFLPALLFVLDKRNAGKA